MAGSLSSKGLEKTRKSSPKAALSSNQRCSKANSERNDHDQSNSELLSQAANASHPRRDNPHRFRRAGLQAIPIDAFPDVTNVQVQVLATAGGMSPPEIEK